MINDYLKSLILLSILSGGVALRTNLNVLDTQLQTCSLNPLTGFTRSGSCTTDERDEGLHLVCSQVTREFLDYTKEQGNDLSTPVPFYGFPGLNPGDRWCLCVYRWAQAYRVGLGPPVVLNATHRNTLKHLRRKANLTLSDLQIRQV